MEITGKTVLVTGSTRGIGLAIAQAFDQLGARVILHGRRPVSDEVLQTFSDRTLAIELDISNADEATKVINGLYEQVDKIDVLINNAGIVNDKLAMGMSPADFSTVINTNLNGTFNVTQPIFKKMLRARAGHILNLSSIVGLMGNVGQANYAASKAGIVGLTKSLAKEGALRGVRVNAIAPGMIVSDMTDALSEKVKETVLEAIPLHRFGQATEIAQTAVFLTENDYVTGQVITVDGGLYI